jgi:glucan biosynthesis protein
MPLLPFGSQSKPSDQVFPTPTTLPPVMNESKPYQHSEMCSTRWYKGLNLEFGAFGTDKFSKVMFLMDSAYRKTVKDRFYKCIFFAVGKYFDKMLVCSKMNKEQIAAIDTNIYSKRIFTMKLESILLQDIQSFLLSYL